MTARLSDATLDRLPADVERPRYDRRAAATGVVHLGIGAFHRAHQAVCFDDLLTAGDLRWGVLGASLRSPGVRDQLEPQDGLYTVVERDGERERLRVIGAVKEVLVAPEDPAALVEAMAAPDVRLVGLTVTEKGYKLDPATGALLERDPDVAHDLAHHAAPRTAPGFLTAALALRRARGLAPFTVLSCDNLPENGARVRAAVLAMAVRRDHALHDWIAERGTFPATMVDRIVPATDDADIARLAGRLGVADHGMVKTEPFSQWVIEDRFAGERPDFEQVGAQVVADVRPWEDAKLRLLNGAHSSLAYLGALAGCDFVHEAAARPAFRRFVERLWDEAETTLEPTPLLDFARYRRELMGRFSNASLSHRTRQIAMDGSQKLPQRLLNSVRERLKQDRSIDALALGVAGWMRWQLGTDEQGRPYTVDDPLAERTRALAARAGRDPAACAGALLSLDAVFTPDLAADARFRAALERSLGVLFERGAQAAVEALAALEAAA